MNNMTQGGSGKGFVLWFTGMSGAGKSTLSAPISERLRLAGHKVELLDGDEVRTHLSKGLSFSKEDRDTNVRRIGFVAELLARNGVVAVTAAISPYREVREEVRAKVEAKGAGFVEVFVHCPIEVLAARDVKGLYKKALAGEIPHFTGVSDPYEPPHSPDVTIDSSQEQIEDSLTKIIGKLKQLGHVAESV
jgi:adenylyl-sulfate kinase